MAKDIQPPKQIKLSVVIPSYKDQYLPKTIQSLLDNSELADALEIIAVFDGYWPVFDLVYDPRVRYIHMGKNGGMRRSINAGVAIARGEFFMRLDEHCSFAKGYDKVLTDACKENEVMTARRYFLDPVKWEVMQEHGYVDYEKLVIQDMGNGVKKFSGQKWRSRDKERESVMVDETMAMQGSMWIAHREFFLKIVGELQSEGYGPMYQDSVEVCMKYWQAGGRLMLNKNTWFAHKHRSFNRTHNEGTKENPSSKHEGWRYSLDTWGDYYINELKPRFGI